MRERVPLPRASHPFERGASLLLAPGQEMTTGKRIAAEHSRRVAGELGETASAVSGAARRNWTSSAAAHAQSSTRSSNRTGITDQTYVQILVRRS